MNNNSFQQVPCDTFINYLNDHSDRMHFDEDSNALGQWMFQEQEPMAPVVQREQRSKAQFGMDDLFKRPKKEEKIIKENKELFYANQSKSIYLTKISQLVETPKPAQKSKRSKVVQDSDSSDFGKSKLAKNRESARNSRKRKKIYIELLENKVSDLTAIITNLESQNNQLSTQNQHLEGLVAEYAQQIRGLSDMNSICQLQEQFGVNSQKRWNACTEIINQLIDATIPYEVKRLLESAQKGIDFFSDSLFGQSGLMNIREQIRKEGQLLEGATLQFGAHYDRLREQTFAIEKLKFDLLQCITPQAYIDYLN